MGITSEVVTNPTGGALAGWDVEKIRADFPILAQTIHGKPLAYFDNAATSQKPRQVIEAISGFYTQDCSNIHRSVHLLGERSTQKYEAVRETVRRFLNAGSTKEIVFVRGATEGINLVAASYGRQYFQPGDEVVITAMEHHSNIVPWQMICEATGATLKVAPINDRGELIFEEFEKLLGPKTKFVSIAHVSNALGTINPVKEMIALAHQHGAVALVDGAQAVPHIAVDVQALDADFYVFSGHKVYAPTGIGILYGKAALLNAMNPYQGGGDMIRSVTFEKTTYNQIPYKFEAGTPNIAATIGLGAGLEYVTGLGLDRIAAWEHELLADATERIAAIPGVRIIGTAEHKASVLSFVIEGAHPHDVGTILDTFGVAVRAGHHCAQPVMDRFHIPATTRASFALYNTHGEIDALVAGIHRVKEVFA